MPTRILSSPEPFPADVVVMVVTEAKTGTTLIVCDESKLPQGSTDHFATLNACLREAERVPATG